MFFISEVRGVKNEMFRRNLKVRGEWEGRKLRESGENKHDARFRKRYKYNAADTSEIIDIVLLPERKTRDKKINK